MALRDYRPDYHPYEKPLPKEQQANFQEYKTRNQHQERLKEILFFVNISIFSIITVMAAYIYLSLKAPAFFAFLLATATGFGGLKLVQHTIKAQYKKLRQKRYKP